MVTKKAAKTERINLMPSAGDGCVILPGDSAGVPPLVHGSSEEKRDSLGLGYYDNLFHSVYDAVILIDRKGVISDVNDRAINLFGYERDYLLTLSLMDLVSEADEQLLITVWDNLLNQRFTLIQAYCLSSDEEYFPAEITVSRLKVGAEWMLCWFFRDISLRRQVEEMLLTEHNAIQNADEGIAVVGADGELEFVNPAVTKLWEYDSPGQLVGAGAGSLFEDSERMTGIINDVMNSQDKWAGKVHARRSGGQLFYVRCSVVCNRNTDGNVLGVVMALSDLTDQLRAEKAQMESEHRRVMLESLGTACHHLGQPATVLLANLGLLSREKEKMNEEIFTLVDECVKAGELMANVMYRLNEFNEYKTTRYLNDNKTPINDDRILDL